MPKVTEQTHCSLSEPRFPSLFNGRKMQDSNLELDTLPSLVGDTFCSQAVWGPAGGGAGYTTENILFQVCAWPHLPGPGLPLSVLDPSQVAVADTY